MSPFKSIQSVLLRWFLVISLIPMGMIGWYGYRAAVTSIEQIQESELEQTATTNIRLVKDWFGEIERDLNAWAGLPDVQHAYRIIKEDWKGSGKPLQSYALTPSYQRMLKEANETLENLYYHYDYVYDIILIDTKGNILLSFQKEKDLLSNLRHGAYASTLFAKAFRQSVSDQKSHFSDVEYYEPSNGLLSGFVTAPIRDDAGKMIGVIALQLKMDLMFQRLGEKSGTHSTIRHYMVGSDGLLRTKRGKNDILKERINTEAFWNWNHHHTILNASMNSSHNTLRYTGPDGIEVIGKYYDIPIMGVQWVHISEISREDALKPSRYLAQVIVLMMVLGVGVIIIASRVLSKRITDPIIALREASRAYASGKQTFDLSIKGSDEIAELAAAFNDMVSQQQKSAKALSAMAEQEQQKSAELEQLLSQTLRLSQVVGQSPSPIAITDTRGKIEYVNQEMVRASGYTLEELIGQPISLFKSQKHSPFVYESLWNRISVQQKVWHGTLIDRMKSGELRDWDSTIFPLFNVEGEVTNYVSIVNDVTEANAKERLLLMQSRQAQMGEMLSMIAHQWRQPLAIINALVGKMLLQEMFKEEPNEEVSESLKQIEDQSLFLSRTITDFRDFFRTDKPKEQVTCSKLIANAMSLIDHAVKTHSLHLTTTLNSDPVINTYANEILQVLITLIKNSLDAFDEHPMDEKWLEISVDQQDDRVIISVQDNAGGIKPQIIDEIFSPYFTTKEGDKGTGLGLYMAKMVVEEHCHGTLSVQSEGGMTTFSISLPLG